MVEERTKKLSELDFWGRGWEEALETGPQEGPGSILLAKQHR